VQTERVDAHRVSARPGRPSAHARAQPGLRPISAGSEEDALLYVPASYSPGHPAPFALLCHGAGSEARAGICPLLSWADGAGLVLLAPDSHGATWDLILGDGDGDSHCIDALLGQVFDTVEIDPTRVAAGGFSDGATYALSLGIANGDLFTHLIAFSPAYVAPPARRGEPRVYMSHGTHDTVLPIDSTSRMIAPALRAAGLDVEFDEFAGGHTVPAGIAQRAAGWLVGRPVPRPGMHESPGEPDMAHAAPVQA
jgi:phospholipase/carboxylesterase